MAGFCSNKKCFKNKKIIAPLAIFSGAAAIWFVWFGTGTLISKELVEDNLQNFSADLNKFADENGKTAKLTYGEIEIAGWGYSKKAIIHNPYVDVGIKGVVSGDVWSLSTNSVQIAADYINSKRIMIYAADPILISDNGRLSQTVSFSEPLAIGYGKSTVESGANIFQQDIFFPKQITITHENTSSETEKGQAIVSFASVPTFKIISIPDEKKKSVSYKFSGLEVSERSGNKTLIGDITGNFNQEDVVDGRKSTIKYDLSLGDIIVSDATHSSKPYAFNLDVAVDVFSSDSATVVEPQPATADVSSVPAPVVSAPTISKKIAVNQFALSGADFNVNARGDVLVGGDDPLPSGLVTLQIDNMQNFLGSELVPVNMKGMVKALLERMTGNTVDNQENVSIPLKRDSKGVFYLGQVSFEELASNFLTDVLISHPAAEPAAPATNGEPQISAPSIAMPAETTADPAPQLGQKTDAVSSAPSVGGEK